MRFRGQELADMIYALDAIMAAHRYYRLMCAAYEEVGQELARRAAGD